MEKFSPTIPVRVGLMVYVAVVMLGLMSYFFYKQMFMSPFFAGVMSVFYICLVLMLAIWSGIAYRSAHGNIISFRDAFLAVYIVFAFCCVGNVFSQLLVNKLIDRDFPRKVYEIKVQKAKMDMERMNKTDDQVKEELAKMSPKDDDYSYGDLAVNLCKMLAGTALFSLLVAMFIKRSSDDLIRISENKPIRG